MSVSGITTGTAAVGSVPIVEIGSGDPIGWFAEATEAISVGSGWSVGARAVCGRVDGLERATATSASTSAETRSVEVSCPPGKEALSGGFELLGSSAGVAIAVSRPVIDFESGAPTGWSVTAWEANATSAVWSVRAEVLCANETIFPFVSREFLHTDPYSLADLTCPRGWIATGGGRSFSGLYTDWINASAPSGPLATWSVRTQRPADATASVDNSFYVLCPEPGGLASAAVTIAALGLRRRSRLRPTPQALDQAAACARRPARRPWPSATRA